MYDELYNSYGRLPAMLAASHSVLLCHLDLNPFRCLISEVAWPIATKLCHMFDGVPDL